MYMRAGQAIDAHDAYKCALCCGAENGTINYHSAAVEGGCAMAEKRTVRGAICAALGGICWGVSGTVGQYLFTHKGVDSG